MEYKEKMIEKIENQRIIPFPSTNQCWKPNCDQDVVAWAYGFKLQCAT